MNSRIYKILTVVLIVLTFTHCAKRGRPTGGEKDLTAPILVSAKPEYGSLNFDAKKIRIYFDEFVKLKDVNKQLIISPPLKNNPTIVPLGTASKVISIKLLDTLKENTTYTFNFGNSVTDNNEGNPIKSFKYVISTGTYIDSLKISGDITDAYSRKTDSDILVMLYEMDSIFNDSIIYKEKPTYVTSTLDSTNFELTNLKEGKYLLMALKQPNNNYIFKPQQDKVGFIKTPITLPTDSIFDITIFNEILPFKFIRGGEFTKGHLIFGYQGNNEDFKIRLLDETPEGFNSETIFEKDKDTLNYWFTPFEKDSLLFEVSNLSFSDTVTVKLKTSKMDSLIVSSSVSSVLNMRDTFAIESTIPILKFDTSKIKLFDKDTLEVSFLAEVNPYKNRINILFDKEYDNKYNLKVLPNALEDVFNNTNDTLNYNFRTKLLEDYGIISLQVSNVNSPIIIELIDDKDNLIASKKINSNETVTFNNLPPKAYIARAVFDDNNNGKWDTGNYLLKTHPEKIVYLNELIEIRANWELPIYFTLN